VAVFLVLHIAISEITLLVIIEWRGWKASLFACWLLWEWCGGSGTLD